MTATLRQATWFLLAITAAASAQTKTVPVTLSNFNQAETDLYMSRTVADGGFGKFEHARTMTAIDHQKVVRMNWDTLYSSAVFDLDAGPVTVTMPAPGKRFQSLLAISEDHYVVGVAYGPGETTFTRDQTGTRYLFIAIRTLADPTKPQDMKEAAALQDGVTARQASPGSFTIPNWDPVSQGRIRDALAVLGELRGSDHAGPMFGTRKEADPLEHLIGTSIGWGGNPPDAATYSSVTPAQNDGKILYGLSVKDVPVDGFWSLSVYNDKGYFEKNALDVYAVNSVNAKKDAQGNIRVQFGGCTPAVANCLPITPGWNYTVRLYRPRPEILNGSWKFPIAQPLH